MPDGAQQPALMTLAEASELARCSTETLRRWIVEGKLPAARVGHKLLVARSVVEQLIAPAFAPAPGANMALAGIPTMDASAPRAPYRPTMSRRTR